MHSGERVAELVHRGRQRILLRTERTAETLDVPAELRGREPEGVALGDECQPVARGARDVLEKCETRAQEVRRTKRGEDTAIREAHDRDGGVRTERLSRKWRSARADNRRQATIARELGHWAALEIADDHRAVRRP